MSSSRPRTFASIAASLDGYIAPADGNLSWLNDAMRRDEDYGFAETTARTGAYIMGANTFRETGGGGSGAGTPTYVVTHTPPEDAPAGVTFYSGDVAGLVERATAEVAPGKDVYVFGGGDVVTQLLAAEALDELTLALVPVLLGGGVRLFGDLGELTRLRLTSCRSFDSGIVLLRYEGSR